MKLKKLLQYILIFSVLSTLVAFAFSQKVSSIDIGDPNDVLIIDSPIPNSKQKGIIEVRWRMYDDEQDVIPYNARLYDGVSCENTFYGNITNQTSGISNAVNSNVINWNSTYTDSVNPLGDGTYCLRLCASMLDGTIPYSVCSSRNIDIINYNSKPVITSVPSKSIFIEGESFSYQLVATDVNNDVLTYRFVQTPSFLTINPSTGLITSGPMTTYGNASISYEVIVSVDDGKAGPVRQSFTITIAKPVVQPVQPTTPTVPPVSTPTTTPTTPTSYPITETPDVLTGITLLNPKGSDVLKGVNNIIKWSVASDFVYDKVVISYSTDSKDWKKIVESDNKTTEISWDVSEIEDTNEMYIKLDFFSGDESKLQVISDKFKIENTTKIDTFESIPLIINVQPENNSEVSNDVKTALSGVFIPSLGKDILPETFKIKLDDVDISGECTVSTEKFICETNNTLSIGKHLVSASIQDSSNQEAEYEWTFTVKDVTSSQVKSNIVNIFGKDISRSGLYLIGLICLLGFILLFVPWILYMMLIRSRNEETTIDPVIQDADTYYSSNFVQDPNSQFLYNQPPPTVNYIYQPGTQMQPAEAIMPEPQGQQNQQQLAPQQQQGQGIDFYEPPATS